MSYISQIPISEVREWLRLDDTSNDSIITIMLNNACKTFEKRTNHFIYQREMTYNSHQRIYDFPIDEVSLLTKKSLYYIAPHEEITLLVGYPDGELPSEIKECIFAMIEAKFYANESEKVSEYPPIVEEGINVFKRYFL